MVTEIQCFPISVSAAVAKAGSAVHMPESGWPNQIQLPGLFVVSLSGSIDPRQTMNDIQPFAAPAALIFMAAGFISLLSGTLATAMLLLGF